MHKKFFLAISSILFFNAACIAQHAAPFSKTNTPVAPDYSLNSSWLALPFINDVADSVPLFDTLKTDDANADVFFIYPTSFLKATNDTCWNASVFDTIVNNLSLTRSITYQATIFNAAGKIYVPIYRQAHYRSFFTSDKLSAAQALEVAYTDVRNAFIYYLKNYNNGRPIIIAAHSQGAYHGRKLLSDFFDSRDSELKLVAAYLIGYPTNVHAFEMIKPCTTATQTNCFISWRCYNNKTDLNQLPNTDALCVNPLTWDTIHTDAPAKLNAGAVLKDFNKLIKNACDAVIKNNYLLCSKPSIRGKILITKKNYHVVDMNLFYMNIRENALLRVNTFLKSQK